jgi:hypothetical protein
MSVFRLIFSGFPSHIKLNGKVTVIKTLALPKLIHLLTSLANLKQSLFNDLNKDFLSKI